MEQEEINLVLVQKALEGKLVVRLKGGDPFVFGRGGEEAEALASRGLPFEVVPGVSSAIAVPAYAGIPVTHREVASSFAVITGREDLEKEWSRVHWNKLAGGAGTLVILMGVESLPETAAKLMEHGLSAATPAAVIERGTEPRQRTVTGTLDDIAERAWAAGLRAPAVTVVGEVVRLREKLRWFDARPLFGKRVLVTRSRAQAGALSKRLEELGAEAIEVPAIEVQPPEDWALLDGAMARLGSFAWAVFTSVNAVEMFMQRLAAAGKDARALAGVRLCAIGPATAEALAARGLRADHVPEAFTTARLAESLDVAPGQRVLLPRADIAPQDLVRGLESRGAIVEQVTAYRTVTPERSRQLAREALASGRIDLVTFTSSSTVQNLVVLLGEDAKRLLANVPIASIGPMTTRTAESLGLRVAVTARRHTIPGLVEAVVEALAPSANAGQAPKQEG
jgi:uroporphyrinogen III methyltransferase/synthase